MVSRKISNLVIAMRNGDDVSERIYGIFKEDCSSFDELEFYQDAEDLKAIVRDSIRNIRMRRCGFIYVADSDGEYVKVGRTKNINQRNKTLNSAGVIDHLRIQHSIFVFDAPMMESKVHQFLEKKYPKKKEFFLGLTTEIYQDLYDFINRAENEFSAQIEKLL